jgi:protein-disulfide isomerase
MPRSQVNLTSAFVTLVLAAFACAPAGTNTRGTESTAAVPANAVTAVPPVAQDSNVTLADLARIEGSASAPVWVIVVSDFQCPYCKQWHDTTFPALENEFVKTGRVRVAYVNFPLNSHAHAWPSAEAAMCAGAQGKFWQMHDAIFDSQARWSAASAPAPVFDSLARTTGVDMSRWRSCVSSGVTKPLIQADFQRAAAAGVRSTPSFLIGDEILSGAHPIENLRRAIDSALVKAAKPGR